jgi:hypothetical protein
MVKIHFIRDPFYSIFVMSNPDKKDLQSRLWTCLDAKNFISFSPFHTNEQAFILSQRRKGANEDANEDTKAQRRKDEN